MKEMPIEEALAMVPRNIILEPNSYEKKDSDFPLKATDADGIVTHIMVRTIPEDERRGIAKMIQYLSGQKSIDLISPDLYFPRWLLRNARKQTR